MQLLEPFDPTKIDPTQIQGGLPIGKHPVRIINSEIKATNANDGGMLVLTLEILDGPNKGESGPYRLNLYNKNQQAKDIAQRQLSAICHVIGVFQVPDTQALHNRPFIVEIGLQKGEEAAQKGYTEVKRVYDVNGNEPGKPAAQPPAPVQQQQPAAAPQPAWGAATPPAAPMPPPPAPPAWGATQAAPGPAQADPNRPPWAQ